MGKVNSLCRDINNHIEQMVSRIGPYLTTDNADYLLGDAAATLIYLLDSEAIVRLAFLSEYMSVIANSLDETNIREAVATVAPFAHTVLEAYQQHLDGWEDLDDEDFQSGEFLVRLVASEELFGFRCQRTAGLACGLAARLDPHFDKPFLLDSYIEMRKQIIRWIVMADGNITEYERQVLKSHNDFVTPLRELAGEFHAAVVRRREESGDTGPKGTIPINKGTRASDVEREPVSERSRHLGSASSDTEVLLGEARKELLELVGLPAVKEEMRRFDAYLEIQRQRCAAGLPISKQTLHFVFSGNPGTGKTTVARILGKLLRVTGCLTGDILSRLIARDW